jgi:hypothetical protein
MPMSFERYRNGPVSAVAPVGNGSALDLKGNQICCRLTASGDQSGAACRLAFCQNHCGHRVSPPRRLGNCVIDLNDPPINVRKRRYRGLLPRIHFSLMNGDGSLARSDMIQMLAPKSRKHR